MPQTFRKERFFCEICNFWSSACVSGHKWRVLISAAEDASRKALSACVDARIDPEQDEVGDTSLQWT